MAHLLQDVKEVVNSDLFVLQYEAMSQTKDPIKQKYIQAALKKLGNDMLSKNYLFGALKPVSKPDTQEYVIYSNGVKEPVGTVSWTTVEEYAAKIQEEAEQWKVQLIPPSWLTDEPSVLGAGMSYYESKGGTYGDIEKSTESFWKSQYEIKTDSSPKLGFSQYIESLGGSITAKPKTKKHQITSIRDLYRTPRVCKVAAKKQQQAWETKLDSYKMDLQNKAKLMPLKLPAGKPQNHDYMSYKTMCGCVFKGVKYAVQEKLQFNTIFDPKEMASFHHEWKWQLISPCTLKHNDEYHKLMNPTKAVVENPSAPSGSGIVLKGLEHKFDPDDSPF